MVDAVEEDNIKAFKTGWKNPPTLNALKEDLTNVVIHQSKHIENIDRWLDLLYVKGTAARKKVQGRSNVQPKLIRKQLEWRIPSLSAPFLDTPNIFRVTGKTHEDVYAATQNALILNYQFNTVIDKVPFIDTYVRTFATEGTVFLRVGWAFEERTEMVSVPNYSYAEPTTDDMFILQQAMALQQSDNSKFIALVPEHVKHSLEVSAMMGRPLMATRLEEDKEEEQTVVVRNEPTLDIVDYRRLYIDPNARGDLDKAEFIIYAFDTSLDELNSNGNYKNLDGLATTEIAPETLTDAQIEDGINFNYSDDTRKKVTAYEYWGNWDIHNNGTTEAIVMTWVGNRIIRMETNPYPDKMHPFVSASYIPVKDSIYGEPDAELLEDTQSIYGATMRSMIDILGRTANGQRGMRQDMLDAINKRKYARGDDYEFNPSVDPRQGIVNHVSPEIPSSAQYMLQLQNSEAESLSGVKAYSQGLDAGSLGDVAAGVRGVLDSTSKRDLDILRRLAYGLIKAARKIIALNAVFLNEEEVVRITEDKFVQVRRDDLAGNFDLDLTISTAEEENNKATQLAFMLQTLGNTVPFDLTKLVLADVAKLRKMPDLAKKLEEYRVEPDPIAQQKAMLELQLLQAQIANEQSKSVESRAEAILKAAKAGNLDANTRKQILDFVEQETGVTQERAKELHQAQSEGNMKLELLKSALTNTNPEPTERVTTQDTGAINV